MTIKINQNLFSRLVQRGLEKTTQKLEKSYERLSSGERINSAADDPAGMAVSEGMRYEMQGLRQNQKNVGGAMSLIGTAESQLNDLVDLAQRVRELAVQGGNDTLNAGDRRAIQAELNQLLEEMNRIASIAQYDDRKLLDGQFQSVAIQIGTQGGETISVSLPDSRTAALGAGTGTALAAINLNDAAAAGQALQTVDAALGQLSDARSGLGALNRRLEQLSDSLGVKIEDITKADSAIRDTDFAYETARLTQNQILQEAATAMLAQANVTPRRALELLQG